ncbi:MAG: sulfite exporter TauE/SafE family protein [Planctomycetales bacterium]|nr:sulfite exporter TauE/SafE family protein [Planctomycetales bacterium]
MEFWSLGLVFGVVVGFTLGLTGGGGSIFAVPLLIYGMGVDPREAVGASLAAVGATSFAGFLMRWRRGEVEIPVGLLFAATGMAGAPIGAWLNSRLPPAALLSGFAVLMTVVALRMWRKARINPAETHALRASLTPCAADDAGPVCKRDPQGRLKITSRCGMLLSTLGFLTGILSGLFGVGGGFVIVPALVLFSGMGIHRAVATSLLVIALIGASGVASYVWYDRPLNMTLATLFATGGVLGMQLGAKASHRLSGPTLQRTFSIAMLMVAVFMLFRQLSG